MNTITHETTLAEIVKENYNAARIFEKYNMDFCCKGKRGIAEVCQSKGIDADTLIKELNDMFNASEKGIDPVNAKMADLTDHIINKHHRYVREMIPAISHHMYKTAKVHGAEHPELIKMFEIWDTVKAELESHMVKEEKMLFPYIKRLSKVLDGEAAFEVAPFGSIINPIKMMEKEHEFAGDGMQEMKELSNSFTPPEGACNTYRVLFHELSDFQKDLHLHVHLENNILFPKAVESEKNIHKFNN